MNLYLQAITNVPDLVIDYITVRLSSGEEVSLNWDYSDKTIDGSAYEATYTDVCFGEEGASGRLDELSDMKILDVGIYAESGLKLSVKVEITNMKFEDGGKELEFRGNFWTISSEGGDSDG